MSDTHLNIYYMTKAKMEIEKIPRNLQDEDYKRIHDIVIKYLHSKCNHNIVCDYIDSFPDKSNPIEYCTICLETIVR